MSDQVGLRFSAKAAMPSFWSLVAKRAWKMRRSKRRPSWRGSSRAGCQRLFRLGSKARWRRVPRSLRLQGDPCTSRHRRSALSVLTSVDGLLAGDGGDLAELGDLLGDLDGLLSDGLLGGDDAGTETPLGGLGTVDLAVGEDHVHGARLANEASQALGATTTGDDAEGDLGLAEGGLLRADEDVGHHGELAATAKLGVSYIPSSVGFGPSRGNRILTA